MLELTAAQRHRQVAADFGRRVVGTNDWNASAPVAGWTARDVVDHLVTWLPGLIASGSEVRLPSVPDVADDPVAAWQAHTAAIQALFDDPAYAEATLSNPHFGTMLLTEAIDRLYVSDVFMHTWDLARATGQDDRLDESFSAQLLAGMEPMDEALRESGQYGAAVPVAAVAPVQDRLIGFIGRDPAWRPAPSPRRR